MVSIGLISYSAYLWHQPLFSFSRIYGKEEPSFIITILLIFTTFFLSYFSWKYVERPFRNKQTISGRVFITTLFAASILLFGFGYGAHKTHGFASRVFADTVSSSDMYISYNQRNFALKRDEFEPGTETNVLVIGNSFGRDFVNVLRETYDTSPLELIYRDDFDVCSLLTKTDGRKLAEGADIITFASNYRLDQKDCIFDVINFANNRGSHVFFMIVSQDVV